MAVNTKRGQEMKHKHGKNEKQNKKPRNNNLPEKEGAYHGVDEAIMGLVLSMEIYSGEAKNSLRQRRCRAIKSIVQHITTSSERLKIRNLTVGQLIDYMKGHKNRLSSTFRHYNAYASERHMIGYKVQ